MRRPTVVLVVVLATVILLLNLYGIYKLATLFSASKQIGGEGSSEEYPEYESLDVTRVSITSRRPDTTTESTTATTADTSTTTFPRRTGWTARTEEATRSHSADTTSRPWLSTTTNRIHPELHHEHHHHRQRVHVHHLHHGQTTGATEQPSSSTPPPTTTPRRTSTSRTTLITKFRASTHHRGRNKDPLDDLLPRQYQEELWSRERQQKIETTSQRPSHRSKEKPENSIEHRYRSEYDRDRHRFGWPAQRFGHTTTSTIATATAVTTTLVRKTSTSRPYWHQQQHHHHVHHRHQQEGQHQQHQNHQQHHHQHRQNPNAIEEHQVPRIHPDHHHSRGNNGHPERTHNAVDHWHRHPTTTPTTTATRTTKSTTTTTSSTVGDVVDDPFAFETHTVPDVEPQPLPLWPDLLIPTSLPIDDDDDDEALQKVDEFDEAVDQLFPSSSTSMSTTPPTTTSTTSRATTGGRRVMTPPPFQEMYTGDITIVTALIDIGRGDWWEYRRPLEKYHEFMENLLSLRNNMVVFTDEKSYEWVIEYRKKMGMEEKTKVYLTRLEDLPLWRYHGYAKEIIDREHNDTQRWRTIWDPQMKQHPEAKSAEYDILVNSKTHFLHNVTIDNPFATGFFVWIDAGYGHGNADVYPYDNVWRPTFPKGKISMIKLTPEHDPITGYKIDNLYRRNWSVISGGFMAGDAHTIGQLHTVVHRKFIELINRDYVDDDQTTMVLAINANPHLFDIVHGDWFDAFRKFDPIFQG